MYSLNSQYRLTYYTGLFLLGIFISYPIMGCLAQDESSQDYSGYESSPEAYNLLPNGNNILTGQPTTTTSPGMGNTKVFDPYAGPPGYDATPKAPPAPPKKRGLFSAGKLDAPPIPPKKEPPSAPREFPASVEPICRVGVRLVSNITPEEPLVVGVYRVVTVGTVIHPQTGMIVGLPSRLELWEHGNKRLSVTLTLMPWQTEPVTSLPPPAKTVPKEPMLNQGPYRHIELIPLSTGDALKIHYQIGDFHLESPPIPIWE